MYFTFFASIEIMKTAGTQILVIRNKKASHDYEFLDKYIAGIKLTGTEIKSIRAGKATLTDSLLRFQGWRALY